MLQFQILRQVPLLQRLAVGVLIPTLTRSLRGVLRKTPLSHWGLFWLLCGGAIIESTGIMSLDDPRPHPGLVGDALDWVVRPYSVPAQSLPEPVILTILGFREGWRPLRESYQGRDRSDPWPTPAVWFSGYRLAKTIWLMPFVKVLGSTIASGVHCLVHDVIIRSLTLQSGWLFTGDCHAVCRYCFSLLQR